VKRKVLCVCLGGAVRSVAMKDVINVWGKDEAWALSAKSNSAEVMLANCRLADIIIPVEPFEYHGHAGEGQNLPIHKEAWQKCVMWNSEFVSKLRVVNIGEDVYGNPRNPILVNLCANKLREAGLAP
jgi:galactitol-specific phosphotransferase system IIB component